jgi:DNA-binding MarR family transcriptional regulator/GNAT superfamily N-acetyltransferase
MTAVARLRRFNRVVTQRVGALDDRFLALDRPLGEARLLWEIGAGDSDVRTLRARLELDSGYMSRLLRNLEAAGLIEVVPDETDRRVRRARLTPAGAAERAELDRRSDALAESLLEPLSASQQQRLVTAMGEVERLLTAALVRIAPRDPEDPAALHCLGEYAGELDRRFETGWNPDESIPVHARELRPPAGVLLVATLGDEPVGCAGLRLHGDEPAEVKRMWVSPAARGLGVGRRLLSEIERRAAEAGAPATCLETNRTLVEAIALYRSAGYEEVEPFNAEPVADHWFAKRLAGAGGAGSGRRPRAG